MPVKVSQTVADQLEAIRASGETSMLDRNRVLVIANREEFYELVGWIDEVGKDGYRQAVFDGIEVDPEGGSARRPTIHNSVNDLVGFDFVYSLEQAVGEGMLVKAFEDRWDQLSDGKPIVATPHLVRELSETALMEIWNAFVEWRREVLPALPGEDHMFSTTMKGKTVWVIEDAVAFTMLAPDDYSGTRQGEDR